MKKILAAVLAVLVITTAGCGERKTVYITPPGTSPVPCGNFPPDRKPGDDSPCYRVESLGGTR